MGRHIMRRGFHCLWSVSCPSLNTERGQEELLIVSTRPEWFKPCHFCRCQLSNSIQNARLWVPALYKKWDAVVQGQTSIAAEVIHSLPYMQKEDGCSYWFHLLPPCGSHCVISARVDSKIAYKMQDLGYPLSMGKGVSCCTKWHPLLLNCFMTFLGYIKMFRHPSDIIHEPHMVQTMLLLPRWTLKVHTKYLIFASLSAQNMRWYTIRKGINCCWNISYHSLDA